MPVNKNPNLTISLESLRPSEDQWKTWREGRNVFYWYAAMLTLQIQPSVANRGLLKEHFPEIYAEYRRRLTVMRRRSRSYKEIQPVGGFDRDTLPSNLIVALPGVAKLAGELGWDSDGVFANRVIPPKKVTSFNGARLIIEKANHQREVEGLGVGQQRTLVRYAALAELVRMAVDSPDEFKTLKQAVFKRRKASNQELGEALARMVATFAHKAGKNVTPYGFNKDANADELAKAKLAVEEHFGQCKG